MIKRVTDPAKKVTDPGVLRELARQGIDKDYVEFLGYGARAPGRSPFMKAYRDLKSGTRIAVVSGLPMCNAQGQMVEVGWAYTNGKYQSKLNLFSAIVDGKQVKLTVLSDQPDGTKKNTRVTYKPQLFIDGVELLNGPQATLLPIDPVNPNYKENTLEWTYGSIARRRIRIFEGRYRDKFFILSNPNGRVSVKHNTVGDLKLKLGSAFDAKGAPLKVTVIGDEEIVEANEFDNKVFPVEIGATATYYPDTNSAGVDGFCNYQDLAGDTWASLRGQATSTSAPYTGVGLGVRIRCDTNTDKWDIFQRGILVIDESDLPSDASVSATTFSVYGAWRANNFGGSINIYLSAPASNTSLANGDYDSLGEATYCDTPIAIGSLDLGGYNNFAFNADPGIVAVQAAADGNTVLKIGIRIVSEAGNAEPTWSSGAQDEAGLETVEKGAGFKPKLFITYEIVTGWSTGDVIDVPIATVAEINGTPLADIAEVNGVT